MKQRAWWHQRNIRWLVLALLLIECSDGLVNTFFFTKPFWIDEWRIIYNLKTRSVPGLWDTLDFLQQFPRSCCEHVLPSWVQDIHIAF